MEEDIIDGVTVGDDVQENLVVVDDNSDDTFSAIEQQLLEFNERLFGVSDSVNGYISYFDSLAVGQTRIISEISILNSSIIDSNSQISETVEVNENGYTAYEQEVINQLSGINTILFMFLLAGIGIAVSRFIKAFF